MRSTYDQSSLVHDGRGSFQSDSIDSPEARLECQPSASLAFVQDNVYRFFNGLASQPCSLIAMSHFRCILSNHAPLKTMPTPGRHAQDWLEKPAHVPAPRRLPPSARVSSSGRSAASSATRFRSNSRFAHGFVHQMVRRRLGPRLRCSRRGWGPLQIPPRGAPCTSPFRAPTCLDFRNKRLYGHSSCTRPCTGPCTCTVHVPLYAAVLLYFCTLL